MLADRLSPPSGRAVLIHLTSTGLFRVKKVARQQRTIETSRMGHHVPKRISVKRVFRLLPCRVFQQLDKPNRVTIVRLKLRELLPVRVYGLP